MALLSCSPESWGISQNDLKERQTAKTAPVVNTPVIRINSKNADGIRLERLVVI